VGDEALVHHPDYSRGEIEFLVTEEWVMTLSDLIKRRTSLVFCGDLSQELLEELGMLQSHLLKWTPERTHKDIASSVS
jgi:glycerol-3-phosphate dehydrogenase